MALRSQPAFHPILHHLLPGRFRTGRALRLAALIVAAWLAVGSAPLPAQRTEREARGVVSSMAGTIYNLAWPTARYEGFEIGALRPMGRGYDVPIVLYGRSAFNDGLLWLELVLELRDGAIHDVRLGRNNAILARPFETLATTAAIVEAIAEEQRRARVAQGMQGTPQRAVAPPASSPSEHDRRAAAALVGTWRDENSVFTFTSGGRWTCRWDSGNTRSGSWTVRNDTVTWYFDNGTVVRYALLWVGENAYQTRELSDGTVWNPRRVRY